MGALRYAHRLYRMVPAAARSIDPHQKPLAFAGDMAVKGAKSGREDILWPRNTFAAQPWRAEIIKIMVLLHSANGVEWQSPPKGTGLKTLAEAEEQGFIQIRGEFQKRQFRLTSLGLEYVNRDKRRLEARRT